MDTYNIGLLNYYNKESNIFDYLGVMYSKLKSILVVRYHSLCNSS